MDTLNRTILELLSQGKPLAVAVILSHKGSTPRTSGTRMVMTEDRQIRGTIGGGLVEARVMSAGLDLLSRNQCRILRFTLDSELKSGLDMVCGGSLSILVATLMPGPDMVALYQAVTDLETAGRKGVLVSRLTGSSGGEFTLTRALVQPDGTVTGPLIVPGPMLADIRDNRYGGTQPFHVTSGLAEYILEPVNPLDTLYILGAGHVGLQLARMAACLDFQVVVMDDRAEFASPERFPRARSLRVLSDFARAFEGMTLDAHAYIVILTRGHLHDQVALAAALAHPGSAYIGMIGSRSKRNTIYENLSQQGISREILAAVHSPVGLDIGAQTPAEIAVSILAQIIQVRSGYQPPNHKEKVRGI